MKVLYGSDILNVHDEAILSGLKDAGVETALATFYHREAELPGFVPDTVFHERFTTFPDGAQASRNPVVRGFRYRAEERKAIAKMGEWIGEYKPDVVFASWTITSGFVAAQAGAKPLALFPWGSDVLVLPDSRKWYRKRSAAALSGADLWVCNARHTAEKAKELSGASPRIEILPVELDAGEFAPEKADRSTFERLFPGKKVVMCTRPLKPLYGHKEILEAMKSVPGAALFLAGEGSDREELEALGGDVHFAGRVPRTDLPALLAACDAYVSASHSDSASLGVFEAMACARPIVASDIPANRECLDGRGKLFRTGDAADLAEKLRDVLETPGDMGTAARAWALEHADRRKNIPKLIAALESLVAAAKS